jgi:DNA-binding response OmpR family regulator
MVIQIDEASALLRHGISLRALSHKQFPKPLAGSTTAAAISQTKTKTTAAGKRVLLIDDDVELCQLLSQYLSQQGFWVEAVQTGTIGLERGLSAEHDIVVLDLMLPDIGGFEVLRRVRALSAIPVLILTALGDEKKRIMGLENGADDYLSKPFNPRELSARIEAILRRSGSDPQEARREEAELMVVEDIHLDPHARVALRAGSKMPLTAAEFNLLELFLKSPGQILSREELVRAVLGREFAPTDRSIDTHVSNLRKKLGPLPDGSERIKGVRGVGYLYALARKFGLRND